MCLVFSTNLRTAAMNNSQLFKQAHQMTKAVIKAGDSYQATFGLCYKAVMAQEKAEQAKHSVSVNPMPKLELKPLLQSDKQHKIIFNKEPVMAYVAAILSFAFFLVFCSPVVAAIVGHFAGFTIPAKSGALVMIESFQLSSAFGVDSLILYAVYSLIGWGEAEDYVSVEA